MKKLFLLSLVFIFAGCGMQKPVNTTVSISNKEVLYHINGCLGYIRTLNGYFPINCEVKNGTLWITTELSKQTSIPELNEQVANAEKKIAAQDPKDRIGTIEQIMIIILQSISN